MERPLRIGVLALQGNVREHAAVLRRLGAVDTAEDADASRIVAHARTDGQFRGNPSNIDVVEVRLPEQLEGLDGLVIPGGESTTIGRLAGVYGLLEPLRTFPGAVLGTCAGMILLSRGAVDGRQDQPLLGLIDIDVRRNAFGRQVASFEADLELSGDPEPLRGVFIRAPWIEQAGAGVEVLAEHSGHPVLAREGRILVAAFHPELTDDTRVHELFLEAVREVSHVGA